MDDNFKNQIATDFGLGKMDPENQEKMIERIGTLLFEAVVERAVDAMDDGAIEDFQNLLDSAGNNYQLVLSFLKERVPGFREIVSDELSRLKRAASGMFA